MHINRICGVLLGVLLSASPGCGETRRSDTEAGAPARSPVELPAYLESAAAVKPADTAEAVEVAPDAVPSAARLQRKIIYNADLELVVENFSDAPDRLAAAVKQVDGFIASSTLAGTARTPRSGQWRIRVPVNRFDELLAALRGLGEVRRLATTSQDVSEEFYDVESRLRNKKLEEARLLKLLDDSTGKLEEVLAVEREITRVRGEIEQLAGRVRLLADLTALSTVTVEIVEIKNYRPDETATLATRVRRRFTSSLAALADTGADAVVFFVGAAPWLAAFGLPLVGLAAMARRRWR